MLLLAACKTKWLMYSSLTLCSRQGPYNQRSASSPLWLAAPCELLRTPGVAGLAFLVPSGVEPARSTTLPCLEAVYDLRTAGKVNSLPALRVEDISRAVTAWTAARTLGWGGRCAMIAKVATFAIEEFSQRRPAPSASYIVGSIAVTMSSVVPAPLWPSPIRVLIV